MQSTCYQVILMCDKELFQAVESFKNYGMGYADGDLFSE